MIGHIAAIGLFVASYACCILYRQKNWAKYVLIIVVWAFFAFNTDNADQQIYLRRYYEPETESLEPLYEAVQWAARSVGLSYQGFRIIYATAFCLALYKSMPYMGYKGVEPLLIYVIYPYCMDITQVRSTISFIPILLGMKYIYTDNDRKSYLKFMLCVLCSALIHSSGLIYILLLVPKKFNLRITAAITGVICLLLILSNNLSNLIISAGNLIGIGERIRIILDYSTWLDPSVAQGTQKAILMTSLLSFLAVYLSNRVSNRELNEGSTFIVKTTVVLLVLVPLTKYSVDVFRIQRALLIMVYCCACNNLMTEYDQSISDRKKVLKIVSVAVLLLVPVSALYVNVLRQNLFAGVIQPIFESNMLFGW